jgi:alpha-beta hydrolase superfamily lysophospholipase
VFDVTTNPPPATSLNVPLYFPSDAPRLFGWLHLPPAGLTADLGLVICKPLGSEAMSGHLSLRAFAEMAAATGVPALRFDYPGTGDSLNIDPNADQIEAWCGDVLAAVDELRRRTGVTRVCLLGFRLGALLATLVAARSGCVDGLILVAPLISGPQYLREMRTTRLAGLLGATASDPAGDGAGDVAAAGSSSMELSGYSVSAASLSALSRVDLAALGVLRVSRMLVIDRDDLPRAREWVDSLSAADVQTEYTALPGFVQMMMVWPHVALIPHAMIAAARDWLLRFASVGSMSANQGEVRRERGSAAAALPMLSIPGEGLDGALSERPVRFGPGGMMFGIVTEPSGGERRRRAVVLVNNGADYHIGAGRIYVSLARRWGRRGYVVLRMDLAGLGDSNTRQGRPDNEVFPPAAVEDVRVAIEFMRERYQVGDLTLAGLCSGAYHALRAGVAAVPLNRIFMVNPENLSWKEGAPIDAMPVAEVVRTSAIYRELALSGSHWRKLLAGKLDITLIVKILSRRVALSLESTLRGVVRLLGVRVRSDLGWQLEQIAARGVRITIVFSRGEPGIQLLRMQGGSAIKRLGERCQVHIIDGADHTFSRSSSRAVLEKILSDELFARQGY